MEAGILKNLIHAIIVDRGPLWFEGYGSLAHFEAFITEYTRQFPQRFGRKRRFIPEMPASPQMDSIMSNAGFTKTASSPYQTVILDLEQSRDTLRAGLRKSWRQSLVKAEKSAMVIEWDDQAKTLPWLVKTYDVDKRQRGYDGPDTAIIRALGTEFAKDKNALIGIAKLDNRPIAAILILCHGRGATYQIGWSSEDGRKYCAHHRLLWEALVQLQGKQIARLDLGGVNDEAAKSIKTFKTGMGGELIMCAGLYV